jgi:hypothetical protein
MTRTNDDGEYRLYGLPAGDYLVRVVVPSSYGAGEAPAPGTRPVPGYAQVFYPATSDPAVAQVVLVAPGEERPDIDISVVNSSSVTVSGRVLSAAGQPLANARVVMTPDGPFGYGTTTDSDGRFAFGGVPAGSFTLWARTLPAGVGPAIDDRGPAEWGTTSIAAAGADVTDVAIGMQPSMTAAGRVVFDASAGNAPVDLAGIHVTFVPVEAIVTGTSYVLAVPATTDASGAFVTRGLTPGSYSIDVSVPSSIEPSRRWTIKAAVTSGRDIADVPIEIGPNEHLADVTITMTDAAPQLSGVLVDAVGRHPAGFSIVVFAADSRYWTPSSRRVRTVQPATDGSFAIALPAGTYRMAAVSALRPDDVTDVSFLEQLVPASVRVTLEAGQRERVNLRIKSRD